MDHTKIPKHVSEAKGEIVWERREFGRHYQVEKLPEPHRVGAGDRLYRLWEDGYPSTGGQWHYTLDSAQWRADYCLQACYTDMIAKLVLRVNNLERQLYLSKQEKDQPVPEGNTHAFILYKDGHEWDRARIPRDYDHATAQRQVIEWEAKIRAEEPDSIVYSIFSENVDDHRED